MFIGRKKKEMDAHIRTHLHSCSQCPAVFTQEEDLVAHTRTHLQNPPTKLKSFAELSVTQKRPEESSIYARLARRNKERAAMKAKLQHLAAVHSSTSPSPTPYESSWTLGAYTQPLAIKTEPLLEDKDAAGSVQSIRCEQHYLDVKTELCVPTATDAPATLAANTQMVTVKTEECDSGASVVSTSIADDRETVDVQAGSAVPVTLTVADNTHMVGTVKKECDSEVTTVQSTVAVKCEVKTEECDAAAASMCTATSSGGTGSGGIDNRMVTVKTEVTESSDSGYARHTGSRRNKAQAALNTVTMKTEPVEEDSLAGSAEGMGPETAGVPVKLKPKVENVTVSGGMDVEANDTDVSSGVMKTEMVTSPTEHHGPTTTTSNFPDLVSFPLNSARPHTGTLHVNTRIVHNRLPSTDYRRRTFHCTHCPAVFFNISRFMSHRKIHSKKGDRPAISNENTSAHSVSHSLYKCLHCPATFEREFGLKIHSRVHGRDGPYKCCVCSASFLNKKGLSCHQQLHKDEPLHKCTECSAIFTRRQGLAAHATTHVEKTEREPNKCSVCCASFPSESELDVHRTSHEESEVDKCSPSPAGVQEKIIRKKHAECQPDKPFKCLWCSATFRREFDLEGHKRQHTGEKPFKCTQCDAAFPHKRNLMNHIKIHVGEKQYKCLKCPSSFSSALSLRQHKALHTAQKLHKCSQCPAAFALKSSLGKHIMIHIDANPHVCSQCWSVFPNELDLDGHKRQHTKERPFKCTQCNAAFAHKPNLKRHVRIHGREKRHKCSLCPASFLLEDGLTHHSRRHHSQKCPLCPARFSDKATFEEHTTKHCLANVVCVPL